MKFVKDQTFICLDCETTGLDRQKDAVIEVAAIKFTFSDTIDSFEALIDPLVPIPPEAMKVHCITQEMVTGKPTADQILPDLFAFIEEHPIIGHSIDFDIEILIEHAKRLNINQTLDKRPFFDTLRLARLYGQSPSNSLEVLRRHFNIPAEGAHRAMSDVVVNVQVFKHLAANFKTMQDLTKALSKPIKMKHMPLGKHKGREFKDVPLQYLLWASHQDFDQDLLFSIRSEIKKRKSGKSFSTASNPFASL